MSINSVYSSLIPTNQIPVVRVMVERNPSQIEIHGFDLLVQEMQNRAPSKKVLSNTSFAEPQYLVSERSKVKVQCMPGGKMGVIAVSDSAKTRKLNVGSSFKISSLGGFIRVGESQYRDDLYVYSFNGDCVVVNHIDLEKYVAGVLDSEMSSKWSLKTLMAQAVAARTYAIYQIQQAGRSKGDLLTALKNPFDLDSSVKDQVYEGAHREQYSTLQAVRATKGMILTYNGNPIKAFYHSTCGGKTETPDRVWGARFPYFQSVRCGYCDGSPRFNWAFQTSAEDVEKKLLSAGLLKGSLQNIQILERNRLGRAGRILIKGSKGDSTLSSTKFRDLVGNGKLRSTDFYIQENSKNIFGRARNYSFLGHGSGHAVGMCQWGAKSMGDQGHDFREILSHYYPKVTISKVY